MEVQVSDQGIRCLVEESASCPRPRRVEEEWGSRQPYLPAELVMGEVLHTDPIHF